MKTLDLNALSGSCKGSLFLADLRSLPDVWNIRVDPRHAPECVSDFCGLYGKIKADRALLYADFVQEQLTVINQRNEDCFW